MRQRSAARTSTKARKNSGSHVLWGEGVPRERRPAGVLDGIRPAHAAGAQWSSAFSPSRPAIAFAATLIGVADIDGQRWLIGWARVHGLVAPGPAIGVEVGVRNGLSWPLPGAGALPPGGSSVSGRSGFLRCSPLSIAEATDGVAVKLLVLSAADVHAELTPDDCAALMREALTALANDCTSRRAPPALGQRRSRGVVLPGMRLGAKT
jgi:hypothetical protein